LTAVESSPSITPVLLSGGSGTRLWPVSRRAHPKQLLPLIDEQTMLRGTLDRVKDLAGITQPLVVGNRAHADLISAELRDSGFDPSRMVLEPMGRNTAPAAASAALLLTEAGDDPLMLLLPADHVIGDTDAFLATAARGAALAAQDYLVAFGVVPTYAETGYGYIRKGEPLDDGVTRVAEFVEKPDEATAEAYLANGDHLWNSGIFFFRASRYLEELEARQPAIVAACRRALSAADRSHGIRLDATAFRSSPSISIDYAVMEHTTDAVVIPLDFGWSDVGSWSSVWDIGAGDEHGNVIVGDVYASDVTGSYLRSDHRLVAAVGITDMLVIETVDAVLVAPRDRAQDIKSVVESLRAEGRREADKVPVAQRSWGLEEVVARGDGYRAERLTLLPGAEMTICPGKPAGRLCVVLSGTVHVGDVEVNPGEILPADADLTVRNPSGVPIDLMLLQIEARPPYRKE